jgi:hypothetical protein
MPNSFPLPSPPSNDSNLKIGEDEKSSEINNSSFKLLERLEKIVPKNILEVLKTVEVDPNELHADMNTTGLLNLKSTQYIQTIVFNLDISTYPWPNTDRLPSPTNDETSLNNTDQAKKLYLLGKNLDSYFLF